MALTKITSSVVAVNSLTVANIADNAVDATKIASNSILTRHIDDDQITGAQLADNITIAGTLTSTGAFTSPGIDDNADATAITIDSSENIGIGISPVEGASGMKTLHLHSAGNSAYLRLTQSDSGSTATDGFDLISGGTEAYVWNREDGNIRFGVDNTEKMRLTDDGEVQLGTSIGNSTYAGQLNTVANLSSGANIQTRNGDGNKHYILRGDNNVEYGSIGLTSATGTGVFQLQGEAGIAFRGAGVTDKMRLDTNGKLIIGDTASHTDDLFQIETPASGGGHGIQIRRNDNNGDQGIGRIMFGNNNDTDLATIQATTDGQADSARLAIFTQKTSGNSTERMRVHSAGGISLTGNHQFNFRANGASNPGNGAIIVFDAVQQGNAANCYNTSTGAYQAAITGWYMVSVGIRYDSLSGNANEYARPQLRHLPDGGSTWQYPHQGGWVDPIWGIDFGSGDYINISYTVPMYLANGDQIQIMNNGNCTNSVNHNESHFGVIFMG